MHAIGYVLLGYEQDLALRIGGLWERFVEFMDDSAKWKKGDKSRIDVYKRATRNCSWNVKLWIR